MINTAKNTYSWCKKCTTSFRCTEII